MERTIKLTNILIFTGYSYLGSCKEFICYSGDKIGNKQMPSRFVLRGIKCEYDIEALMIRKDLYLHTESGAEYIVADFLITDINDIDSISGITRKFGLVLEKFPEMKIMIAGEKVIVTKETQIAAFKTISEAIHNIRIGHVIDGNKTRKVSEMLLEEVIQAPDAIMNLMKIKSFDDYTLTHSINVATISLLIGQFMELGAEEMGDLANGAILHDIGKLKVPVDILNKEGRLTEIEFAEMRKHSTYGYDLLSASNSISNQSRMVVLQHHERFQGTGYPKKLKGDEINLLARICAIADAYDALTTDLPYRVAMSPYEAMRTLTSAMDNHFDPKVLTAFIRKFSLYPNGSLITLNDGSIALVVKNNESSVIRPVIKILADSSGKRLIEGVEVNLLEFKDLYIKGPASPSQLAVPSQDF